MIQIQILAGSSDKPSISSDGFSHCIFTAFFCSYLLKSVPKPLKDTSFWPWTGGWGICTQWRICSFSRPLLRGSFPVVGGFRVSPVVGWRLAREGCGMACSGVARLYSHRATLSPPWRAVTCLAALHLLQCELCRPGNQMLVLPRFPTSSLCIY